MKVIAINEENHGQIAIVSDYYHAIMWLVNNKWLTDNTEVRSESHPDWDFLKDCFGKNWVAYMTEKWDIKDFNDFFDGSFFLNEIEVYDTDNEQKEEEKKRAFEFSGTWYYTIYAKNKEEAIKIFDDDTYAEDINIDWLDYNITEIKDEE